MRGRSLLTIVKKSGYVTAKSPGLCGPWVHPHPLMSRSKHRAIWCAPCGPRVHSQGPSTAAFKERRAKAACQLKVPSRQQRPSRVLAAASTRRWSSWSSGPPPYQPFSTSLSWSSLCPKQLLTMRCVSVFDGSVAMKLTSSTKHQSCSGALPSWQKRCTESHHSSILAHKC